MTSTQPLDTGLLTAAEHRQHALIADPGRAREWLTGRRALRLLLGTAGEPPYTAGHTFPHRRLSLSHTRHRSVAAGVLGPVPSVLAGLGVDLEPPRAADPRAARFFLRPSELDHVRREGRDEQVRLWTIKEALFKADPANHGTVLRDYLVPVPSAAHGTAYRDTDPTLAFGYCTGRCDGAHLAIGVAIRISSLPGRTSMPAHPMSFTDVAERVGTVLNVAPTELTADTVLRDLVRESFTLVELVIDLQEEFGTSFGQAELREVTTLGDLAALLHAPARTG